jgi:transposase
MESAVTIGLDLGESVFQVHGIDACGRIVIQRRLTRGRLLAFFCRGA